MFTNSYGLVGAWCWINIKSKSTTIIIWSGVIYGFIWLNMAFQLYSTYKTIMYFRLRSKEIRNSNDKEKEREFIKKYILILILIPIILLVTKLPGSINRWYEVIVSEESTLLYTIHAFVSCLQGFLNSLAYSFFYRKLIKCCPKKQDPNEELTQTKSPINNNFEDSLS